MEFLKQAPAEWKAKKFFEWEFWAREKQIAPPGDWSVWLILTGRGWGKTRSGAEWVRGRVEKGVAKHIALIGQTAADVRDVMVEGPSGLLRISPPWFRPKYEPSKRRLTWPNSATATTFSGDEPDQLRGPEHDTVWADEPAKWKYGEATWDNMEMGLRVGENPRVAATTTPRPIPLIRKLLEDPRTVVTRASTYDNYANLPEVFIARVIRRYQGTRLGRQELNAEILEDNPFALWKRGQIEEGRVTKAPDLTRIVVAVDPGANDGESGAETGIVVAGKGADNHGYVVDDRSLRASPNEWAKAAVTAYHLHKADRLIAEANQGGTMVKTTIETIAGAPPVQLVHASRGKLTRAEPVAALYEQGQIHHVGTFPELEDQMFEWVPGQPSPDRMDALVWGVTALLLNSLSLSEAAY